MALRSKRRIHGLSSTRAPIRVVRLELHALDGDDIAAGLVEADGRDHQLAEGLDFLGRARLPDLAAIRRYAADAVDQDGDADPADCARLAHSLASDLGLGLVGLYLVLPELFARWSVALGLVLTDPLGGLTGAESAR